MHPPCMLLMRFFLDSFVWILIRMESHLKPLQRLVGTLYRRQRGIRWYRFLSTCSVFCLFIFFLWLCFKHRHVSCSSVKFFEAFPWGWLYQAYAGLFSCFSFFPSVHALFKADSLLFHSIWQNYRRMSSFMMYLVSLQRRLVDILLCLVKKRFVCLLDLVPLIISGFKHERFSSHCLLYYLWQRLFKSPNSALNKARTLFLNKQRMLAKVL